MKDYTIPQNLNTSKENTVRNKDNEGFETKYSDKENFNNFWITPNLVASLKLDPFSFSLYAHLLRVAGQNSACWMSNTTLASDCSMSIDSVRKAKKTLSMPLAQLDGKSLITIYQRYDKETKRQNTDLIEITYIWDNNDKFFNKDKTQKDDMIYVKKTFENDGIQKMFPGSVTPTPPLGDTHPPPRPHPHKEYSLNNTKKKEEEESIVSIAHTSEEAPISSLSSLLSEKINTNTTTLTELREWGKELEALRIEKGLTEDELKNIIKWIFESVDEFWRSKVKNPASLKKNFDTILKQFQMKKESKTDFLKKEASTRDEIRHWCYALQQQDHLLPAGTRIKLEEKGLYINKTFIDYLQDGLQSNIRKLLEKLNVKILGINL